MVDDSLSWPDQMFVCVYLIDRIMAGDRSGTTAVQVPKGGIAELRAELGISITSEIPAFPNGDIETVSLPSVPLMPQQIAHRRWNRRSGRHRK